ncbi:MAG: hypothetical protein JXR96_02875 [Deltaproteobacteria bacterium]|nr:hypothetical protein [Deltaproteobacteria bacterium]
MRRVSAVLTLCVLCAGLELGAAEAPVVVVFEIQQKRSRLAADLLGALTDYLATAISERGSYRVVPPETLKRALLERKAESHKACYDEKCQIEMGRALAANKMLATTILRIGKQCVVSARLYDLKKEATELSAKAQRSCTEADLLKSLDEVAERIRGQARAPSAAAGEPGPDEKAPPQPAVWPLPVVTRNVAQVQGEGNWRWTVFVEGPQSALDRIRCVEYTLHPTFRDPVKMVCQRGGRYPFGYTATGWGTFDIKVRILTHDGRVQHMVHPLKFR